MVTDEQIAQAAKHFYDLLYTQWVDQQFLSPTWFFLILILVFSYALFIYLADKERIIEILLYGSLIAVSFANYDSVGQQFHYWVYYKSIVPFFPNLFLGDITIIPVYAMLIYQYTSSWKRFIIWNTVWAGLFTFVIFNGILAYLHVFAYIKPFSVWLDFSLFWVFGIACRAIMVALLKTEVKRGRKSSKVSLSMLISKPSAVSPTAKLNSE